MEFKISYYIYVNCKKDPFRNSKHFSIQHVAILDIDEAAGIAYQKKLTSKYGTGKAQFYRVDVTNDEQLFAAFNATAGPQGGLDLVINNAGIMNDAPHIYKKEIAINVVSGTSAYAYYIILLIILTFA